MVDDLFVFIIVGIIVVIVVGVIIAAVVTYNRTTNQHWTEAAARLGMRYSPPSFFSSIRSIAGTYEGFPVVVDTFVRGTGKHARHFSRFRVNLISPLSLGLKISRQGFFSGVAKLFGAQDIETGDAEFDNRAVVKGMSPTLVNEFLTPTRRAAVSALIDSLKEATIDDEAVIWQKHGIVRDAGMMVATVETMIRVARLLGPAGAAQPAEETGGERVSSEPLRRPADDIADHVPNSMAREIASFDVGRSFAPADVGRSFTPSLETDAGQSTNPSYQSDDGSSGTPPYEGEEGRSTTPSYVGAAHASSVDGSDVAKQLFESGATSFRVHDLFRERFQGKSVSAKATLRSVSDFAYDSPFAGKEGCRAVFELAAADGEFSNRGVQAIVLLPTDLAPRIRTQIGARLSFWGTLVHCDGLLRNLFVADARLEA